MPKKGRKRLTQRKGTSISGLSTRSVRNSPAVCVSNVSSAKMTNITVETSGNTSDVPQCTSSTIEEFPLLPSASKRIRILENILLIPAQQKTGDYSPISSKGKKKIGYYSVPVVEEPTEYRPYIASKPNNCIQHAVQLIVFNKNKASTILSDLSLDDDENKSLIFRMVQMFPSTKADQLDAGPSLKDFLFSQEKPESVDPRHSSRETIVGPNLQFNVNVMIHHTAASQINKKEENTPNKRPTAVNLSAQHLDSITIGYMSQPPSVQRFL